jgi:class 3 adenylate cyclase/tetratricopeptide (TPR) repeat protein
MTVRDNSTPPAGDRLTAYVPVLVDDPEQRVKSLDGTLLFSDVSGFTKLSEKLAELGKAGAEELTEILMGTFTDLLGEARDEGGDLLSFGGDALLLAFVGKGHAARATRAAVRMRSALKARGPVQTGRGKVLLKISQGVHTGTFHLVLAGDRQRELLVTGPDATLVTDIEGAASAGQVVVSQATAAHLPDAVLGGTIGSGRLVRRLPPGPETFEPLVAGELDRSSLVPDAVRRRAESGEREAEHRRVAVGFVHVMGVDDHLARHGPELTADALTRVTTVFAEAAEAADVCLVASDLAPDGAKLILTAGAPEAVEDVEGRLLVAARAALDHELPLPVRVGAHVGHVFASDVGAPWRHVYTVIGDAVNLSARLMGKAEPGQIVASEALLERTATPFETTELEPFMVKGKRQPQRASIVGGRIEGRGRAELLRSPFVGRDAEMAVLNATLASATAGRGSCVELIGPPGIGKSRLVDEVLGHARTVERVRITCEPFQTSLPYFVARLVFRRLMGLPGHADRSTAGRELAARVRLVAPEQMPWLPLLADVVEADCDPTPEVDGLDAAHRGTATAEVANAFLAALAPVPQVFVFEDAMWMDEASARLFARALADVERRPWFVCTTRRDTEGGLHPGLGFDATSVRLEPLSSTVAQRLVHDVTDEFGLSTQDVERLCARAAGNPLYLVELLRAVLDARSLEDLPDSLEDIIASRIDRLPRRDRRLLRVAAVLGDRFEATLLEELGQQLDLDDPGTATTRLSEFVSVDRHDLVFEHDLVRQVAYEGLPYIRRRSLHRSAASMLAERPGRPDDDRLAMLAEHWHHAGDHAEAFAAQRRAAERAQRKFAHHEASLLLERAIDHGEKVGVDSTELADLAERLGDSAELAGRFDAAITGYRAARRHYPPHDDAQIGLLRKEGLVRERLGRYDAALDWFRRGLREANTRDDHAAMARRAELEVSYAGVRFRQGKLRNCVRWCERALSDSTVGTDPKTVAHAHYVMGAALAGLNDERASTYEERAVEMYRELGDHLGLGRALMNMGVSADERGEFDAAADLYQQSREALLRAGYALGLAHVSQNLAEIRSDQGRLEEAEALLRDARRAATAAQYSMMMWITMCSLGRVATRARRFEEALGLLERAREGFDEIGAASWAVETLVLAGEAHLFADAPDGALEELDMARHYGEEALSASGVEALELRVRGCALSAIGREADGRALVLRSIDEAAAQGADFDLLLSLVESARLPGTDPRAADEAVRRARRIAERMHVDLRVVCPDSATLPQGLIASGPQVLFA